MISMPTAEQIALTAAYVALSSPLMEVTVDGEKEIQPTEVPLQLAKPEEQQAMDDMVRIACTLFFYEDVRSYEDIDDLMQETLHCWAEGVLS